MIRYAGIAFILILSTVFFSACNGAIFISHPSEVPCSTNEDCTGDAICLDGYCSDTHTAPCSQAILDGNCPTDKICSNGVCISEGSFCDCTAEQDCQNGICIDNAATCSPDALQGICQNGDLCIDGNCVSCPSADACSATQPDGCCPQGAACLDGYCTLITDFPCSPETPDGLCRIEQECVLPGNCIDQDCDSEHLFGICEDDNVCQDGFCEPVPCSPGHLSGFCAEGSYCSAAGLCVADDSCADHLDCQPLGKACSTTGVCIEVGSCLTDGDCQDYHICNLGISQCERDYSCSDDEDCPSAEFCSTSSTCLLDGECYDDNDCNVSDFCSSSELCLSLGKCLDDQDCDESRFCSDSENCIPDGSCDTWTDCPPGRSCLDSVCTVAAAACTTNDTTSVGCEAGELYCCPPGESCCLDHQRCSTDGLCITRGECFVDQDCLTPYFSCVDYVCEGTVSCNEDCAIGQQCSWYSNICIPEDQCILDRDCPEGEICGADFSCESGENCGNTVFETTLVPPNMLVVLDRSGSMNASIGYTGVENTRWNVARASLNTAMSENEDKIRFGLSTYPYYCPGSDLCSTNDNNSGDSDDCSNRCNWNTVCDTFSDSLSCNSYSPCIWDTDECVPADSGIATGNNYQPGDVDVAVGLDKVSEITASLSPPASGLGPQHPGGYTPTGRTLRNIAADASRFGLPADDDPTPRDNYVLLLTDGDANGDGGTYGVCDGTYGTDERVACALGELQNLADPIKTFVVGFVGGSDGALNCGAVAGGTSLCASPDECSATTTETECLALTACNWSSSNCSGGVDETNCSSTSETCFFRADDATELSAAFQDIVGTVASCSYALGETPPDEDRLYIYLDYHCSDRTSESDCLLGVDCTWASDNCSGEAVRLEKDSGSWVYDQSLNQIDFLGSECDAIKSGTVSPLVVYGCPELGG